MRALPAIKIKWAYLEDVDELGVGDVAVLVLVESVEDDAELLPGEEDTQLGHELLELQLLEHSVLVSVETLFPSEATHTRRSNNQIITSHDSKARRDAHAQRSGATQPLSLQAEISHQSQRL